LIALNNILNFPYVYAVRAKMQAINSSWGKRCAFSETLGTLRYFEDIMSSRQTETSRLMGYIQGCVIPRITNIQSEMDD